jgi:hypothetical protein
LNLKDYRVSVAPMMDWSESSGFSIGWKTVSARRVHRETKKNLAAANVSKLSEVGESVAESVTSSPRIRAATPAAYSINNAGS